MASRGFLCVLAVLWSQAGLLLCCRVCRQASGEVLVVQADTDVATWAALPVGLTRHVAVGHLEVALCSFVHVAPAFSARNQH